MSDTPMVYPAKVTQIDRLPPELGVEVDAEEFYKAENFGLVSYYCKSSKLPNSLLDKNEIAPNVFVFNNGASGDVFVRLHAQVCQ